ncbi:hypothetical protein ZEAMMB73_Zm00001d004941 [Zea mays]|uniref:Uncharacterized protein n=1 Tax=Zea mays TaxID=4577 RepID=A0A1D6EI89_MAIZE|nr:hypothetical protein ZEAMMB73_Zm00001d004941 [Zea mays]
MYLFVSADGEELPAAHSCGQVDDDGDQWYEIKAAFKLEKQPSKVTAYVQGPPVGVDLRVMDFYIYAVGENRQEFFQFMTLVIVSLAVDKNQWVNCGQVDADGDQWYEIKAAFKLEKQPSKVTAYVQGLPAGVDLRVMDFYIYAVGENRQASIRRHDTFSGSSCHCSKDRLDLYGIDSARAEGERA